MRNFGNTNENNESGWWNSVTEGASDAFNYVTGEGLLEDVLYYTTPGEGFLDFSNEENSNINQSNFQESNSWNETEYQSNVPMSNENFEAQFPNNQNTSNYAPSSSGQPNANTSSNVPKTPNQVNSNISSGNTSSSNTSSSGTRIWTHHPNRGRSSSSGSSSYVPPASPNSNTPRYRVFTPEKGAAAGVGILVGMAIGAALFRR